MNSDIHEFIIHMVISSTIYIYIYIYIEFIWLFHVWIHMHINSHVWIHGFALISSMNSYYLWIYTWNWGCQDSRWPLTTHYLLGAGTISSISTHMNWYPSEWQKSSFKWPEKWPLYSLWLRSGVRVHSKLSEAEQLLDCLSKSFSLPNINSQPPIWTVRWN